MSCGAPQQTATLPDSVDATTSTIIQGKVCVNDTPVEGAFVRLLDGSGEFTAEVVTSPEGDFRFFAAPGDWTVRALSRSGNGTADVSAAVGVNDLTVAVA